MANILQDRSPKTAHWSLFPALTAGLIGLTYAGMLGMTWHTPTQAHDTSLKQAVADFDAGHLASATTTFRTLADHGNPTAAYWYGHALDQGLGTPVDTRAAIVQFKKAAAGGVFKADTRLGELYLNGNAVPPDFSEARTYLTEAARHGDGQAALDLGRMLQQGIGASADPVAAYAWLEVASLDGNAQARQERDQLLSTLSPAQQAQAVQQANALAPAAHSAKS